MGNEKPVNPDLVKERQKCTFDVNELIYLIDGGKENTLERKEVEKLVIESGLVDGIPEGYLSHKDKYENVIQKACHMVNLLKTRLAPGKGLETTSNHGPTNTYRVTSAVTKDMSPFLLHYGMFIPAIAGQGTPEQQKKWLPRASNMNIIGTYAQTELGHGTFIRGLETTATYDPKTEEFVLNSPTLTSYKWWPGGLGQTANYCVVVAQVHSNGKNHGIHPFVVQIRDEETHIPLPGVSVGEIGPKMAFQNANNGFLGFKNVRIPRDAMLMKNAQVLKDGTFVRGSHDKMAYGTMVYVRVIIVNNVSYELAKAATIAVRYSAVRHQSQPKPNEPEPQILDYVTQQHKLFISIATSHAFRMVGSWLWNAYANFRNQLSEGNVDALPELHSLTCCLKAITSRDTAACVEQCRLGCGGHGYMMSSNLPLLYAHITAANTYEGENTVLLLQTARFLLKAWQQASEGNVMTPTVAYLVNKKSAKWENTPEGIIRGFQEAAAGSIQSAVNALQKQIGLGAAMEDAWNLVSVQLVTASELHCRAVLCDLYWKETLKLLPSVSKNLGDVLKQLAELYLVYWTLEKVGDMLLYSNISKKDVEVLRLRYEELLSLIRPNAVGLVDSFDICDEVLNSALGAYDGRVYERLMEEAMKSPLNAEPVNQSFHKYLKPFMQGKL